MLKKQIAKLKEYLAKYRLQLTSRKITLSVVAGIAFGLFPVIGTTTVLCLIVAAVFRLDITIMQIVNYLIYPLQLAFIIPFAKLGESISSILGIGFTKPAESLFSIKSLIYYNANSVIGWVLILAPLAVILYYPTLRLLEKYLLGANINSHET